jgi:vitamin B12 transporter
MLLPILFLILTPGVRAAEPEMAILPEIVVDGKRLRGDHRSAVVITESELARESGRSVGTVLRETAGVDFVSGTGGNSNVLIRGASGSQTLVLIDGVKANDPSATNRYFDWSRIDVTQIERIEVLKGPQAVSYGSDAIGGVILIRTKRGGRGTSAWLEAGSEAFTRARVTVGTPIGDRNLLSLQAFGKGVFSGRSSALGASPSMPVEGDDLREGTVGAELATDWSSRLHSSVSADLRAAHEEIDDGAFADDPNSLARNREIRSSFRIGGDLSDRAEWSGLISHLDFRRAYGDLPDAADPFGSGSVFRGTNSRAEMQIRNGRPDELEFVVGSEATRETLALDSYAVPARLAKDEAHTAAVFGEAKIPLVAKSEDGRASPDLSADFGARLSQFTTYGRQWSGKAGLSSRIANGLEADIGLSSGFKAPSLYSLYDPLYGNSSLKPEESVQAEAGFGFAPSHAWQVSLRIFESRIRNRFGFDPATFRSLNIERADIRGVEFENEFSFAPGFRLRPHLTYLSSHDHRTGRELTDIPRWKGGAKLEWDATDSASYILSVLAKSSRGSSAGALRVSGFSRVDLTARTKFRENWSFSARIENAFDRDYQEIRGYSGQGLSAFAGIEYRN